MKKVRVELTTTTDPFTPHLAGVFEVVRILRSVTDGVVAAAAEKAGARVPLRDSDGNRVGWLEITD